MFFSLSGDRGDAEQPLVDPRWTLAAIVAVGTVLRLSFLDNRSYWLDEVISVELAQLPSAELVRAWTSSEPNMPFYIVLLHLWISLFGEGEWAVRLLSCLPSIAVIPAVYGLARRLFDQNTAILSAALLAVHAFQVRHAQEARSYSLAEFLVVLSCWALVEAVRQPRMRRWIVYVLVSVVAVYAHVCAAFVLAGHALSVLLCRFAQPARRGFLLSAAAIVLLTLPLLWLVTARAANLDTAGIAPFGIKGVWRLFLGIGGTSPVLALLSIVAMAIAMLPARRLPPPAIATSKHSPFGIPEEWARWFVFAWFSAPLVLLALISARKSFMLERYLIVAGPALAILVARALLRAPTPRLLRWSVAVMLVLSTERVIRHYRKAEFAADWRQAAAVLDERVGAADGIVVIPYYTRICLDHYQRRDSPQRPLPIVWPAHWRVLYDPPEAGPTAQDFHVLAGTHQRLWVLLSHTKDSIEARVGPLVDGAYSPVATNPMGAIVIGEYQRIAE